MSSEHTGTQRIGRTLSQELGMMTLESKRLPYLQNCPLFSTRDSKHHHLWGLGLQEWPYPGRQLAANSIHRPHCVLNLKKTRSHAQQLVHKTLITISLLERFLTTEGVTHRSDGKSHMGEDQSRAAPKAGDPGTRPSSGFPDQLLASFPRTLRPSLGTPKGREPSLHLPVPQKALWPLGRSGKWLL